MLKLTQNIGDHGQGFPLTRLMYVHIVEYGKRCVSLAVKSGLVIRCKYRPKI